MLYFFDAAPVVLGGLLAYLGYVFDRQASLSLALKADLSNKTGYLEAANEKLKTTLQNQKDTEVIISRAKRAWEATFDAVQDLMIQIDMDGRIIRCNQNTVIPWELLSRT